MIKSHETDAYGKCDVMLCIWTESKVHVHKLHKDEDDDDLKITETANMPVITADSVVTDDPIDELVDTGDHDRPVCKIKSDSEVYNKGTAGDPVTETTTITDDSEKESVTLNTVSQGKTTRKSAPWEGIQHSPIGSKPDDGTVNTDTDGPSTDDHPDGKNPVETETRLDPTTSKPDDLTEVTNECVPQKNLQGLSSNEPGLAGMLDDRAKQEDDNIEDETEVKEHAAGTDKEMKLGKACYCINCDSGVESKGDVSNHVYETHAAPTIACGNCHTTFKDVLYLESHKEGYNDYVLKCEMSSSYEVEG